MARISANPIWQLLDEGGDVVATLNNDGSSITPVLTGGSTIANWGVGTSPLQSKVLLTSAQLLALKTTPIQLTPTPQANQIIFVENISLRYLFNTAAYTLNAGTFKLFLGPVGNAVPILADQSALLTAVANGTVLGIPGVALGSAASPLTDAKAFAQPVFAVNDGGANYTVGAGTVEVLLTYDLVALP